MIIDQMRTCFPKTTKSFQSLFSRFLKDHYCSHVPCYAWDTILKIRFRDLSNLSKNLIKYGNKDPLTLIFTYYMAKYYCQNYHLIFIPKWHIYLIATWPLRKPLQLKDSDNHIPSIWMLDYWNLSLKTHVSLESSELKWDIHILSYPFERRKKPEALESFLSMCQYFDINTVWCIPHYHRRGCADFAIHPNYISCPSSHYNHPLPPEIFTN